MTQSPQQTDNPAAFMDRYRAWQEAVDGLIIQNKTRLMASLKANGITRVTVAFDGSGDSGQIEDFLAYQGKKEAPLGDSTVDLLDLPYGAQTARDRPLVLAEAVETLCYDLLRAKHDGWENSDGAYGEFEFVVDEDLITLDFNERFTSSENHTLSW